jgi:hypothetical protein
MCVVGGEYGDSDEVAVTIRVVIEADWPVHSA